MAALLVCNSYNADHPHEEMAVVVGRKTALLLPFQISQESKLTAAPARMVELALCTDSQATGGSVQTSASSTNGKDTGNVEGTGADTEATAAAAAEEEGQSRHTVASAALSADGQLLAVCGDGRNIFVFATSSWTKVHQWAAKRRICTICFSAKGQDLLLADRTGDVYRFQCGEGFSEDGELILGHISVLLDIGVSLDNRYVFSADRDDKIRVSRYPNAYNIESFCLGHTQFVSCLAVSPAHPDHFFSGSGDGSVIVWHHQSGALLARLELPEKQAVASMAVSRAGVMAVAQEGLSLVHIISTECNSLEILQTLPMPHTVFNVAFSLSNVLWTISDDQNQPLAVVDVPASPLFPKLTEDASMQQCLSKYTAVLTGCLHSRLDMSMLTKDAMDGMHRYFERKQERLQGTGKATSTVS